MMVTVGIIFGVVLLNEKGDIDMSSLRNETVKWEIDLAEQRRLTQHVISLRGWLISKSNFDHICIDDLPEFQKKLNEKNRLDISMIKNNPSSYMPYRTEAFVTNNEGYKLCQVIRFIGENKFYTIVNAVGIKDKYARDIVDFWTKNKQIDEKRERAYNDEIETQKYKEIVEEIDNKIRDLSFDKVKQVLSYLKSM